MALKKLFIFLSSTVGPLHPMEIGGLLKISLTHSAQTLART